MKLPKNREVIVPERKITEYLLSASHPVGKAKAGYFRGLGYSERNASQLKDDLAAIGITEKVTEVIDTPFGRKYVVDGVLTTPSGVKARVRTIWIVEAGEDVPRFVTAYPRQEENRGVESD